MTLVVMGRLCDMGVKARHVARVRVVVWVTAGIVLFTVS